MGVMSMGSCPALDTPLSVLQVTFIPGGGGRWYCQCWSHEFWWSPQQEGEEQETGTSTRSVSHCTLQWTYDELSTLFFFISLLYLLCFPSSHLSLPLELLHPSLISSSLFTLLSYLPLSIHTVVLDCAPIGFMDAVGVKTLQQTVLDFDKCDIQVLLAAMTSMWGSTMSYQREGVWGQW